MLQGNMKAFIMTCVEVRLFEMKLYCMWVFVDIYVLLAWLCGLQSESQKIPHYVCLYQSNMNVQVSY